MRGACVGFPTFAMIKSKRNQEIVAFDVRPAAGWPTGFFCESVQTSGPSVRGTVIGVIEFIVLAHRRVHAHLGVGETRWLTITLA